MAAALSALSALVLPGAAGAASDEVVLRLRAAPALVESGLVRYLLPRFRFKTRIRVVPVEGAAEADLALTPLAEGRVIATETDGATSYRLAILATDPERRARAERFLEWLLSPPGRAAIEAFPPGRPPLYAPAARQEEVVEAPVIDGSAARGLELSRRYCVRCHVVEESNRLTGIESTPSFMAMRSFDDWYETFRDFWSANPHRALISMQGLTDKKRAESPVPIAPITLTLDDVDDILAYIEQLPPKDLGAPLSWN